MYHTYIYRQNLCQQTIEVIAPNPHRFWVGMRASEQPMLCNTKHPLCGSSRVWPGLGPDVKNSFGFGLVKSTKGKKTTSLVFQPKHQTLVNTYR